MPQTRTTRSSCELFFARRTANGRTPHQAIVQDAPGSVLGRLAQLPPLNLRLEGAPPQQASQGTYPPFLPGAGLTRRVLAALKEQGTPGGALAAWVVEGDNRGDAHALAARTLQITGTGKLRRV